MVTRRKLTAKNVCLYCDLEITNKDRKELEGYPEKGIFLDGAHAKCQLKELNRRIIRDLGSNNIISPIL